MMKIWIKGVVILNMLCRITFIFPLNGAEIYRRFSLERWTCDMEVPPWPLAEFILGRPSAEASLESLRNDDGDGNENGNKAIDLFTDTAAILN